MGKKIPYNDMIKNYSLQGFFPVDDFVSDRTEFDDLGGHDSLEAYYDESLDED